MEENDQVNIMGELERQDDANIEKTEAMLDPTEARILGALMEKQLTTPDGYPLTLNSLILACNQKSSREPVLTLEEGQVQRCLYDLQERKLIEFEYGSRANKFDQRLVRFLRFNEAEHAIFCIMLLRGPQTVNELLSRSKRMYEFENQVEVEILIEKLLSKVTPQLMLMPQQSGQRERRYMHLLCGEPDASDFPIATASAISNVNAELVGRVEELERQVALLLERIK